MMLPNVDRKGNILAQCPNEPELTNLLDKTMPGSFNYLVHKTPSSNG